MEALSMTDPLNKKYVHFDHLILNITSKITWYIYNMVYFLYIYTYFEIKPRTYAKVTCSVKVLTLEFLAHIAL